MEDRPDWVDRVAALNGGMLCRVRLNTILQLVECMVERQVPGACVEIGCNRGLTAALMQSVLARDDFDRELHVFDSFEGVSAPEPEDIGCRLRPGMFATSLQSLVDTFNSLQFPMPTVHAGWLSATISQLPPVIAFAHIDVDLYEPTYLALSNIYSRLAQGGVIVIDDYAPPDNPRLDQGFPGVWRACSEFRRITCIGETFELRIGEKESSDVFSSQGILRKTASR
jgi:O-methyltransferase